MRAPATLKDEYNELAQIMGIDVQKMFGSLKGYREVRKDASWTEVKESLADLRNWTE